MSFSNKHWLHSVIAAERWHRLWTDWFPVSQFFPVKLRDRKTGRCIVFPGHCLQVMVKVPEWLWKFNAAKEKEPLMEMGEWRKQSYNKSEWKGIYSVVSAPVLCKSLFPTWNVLPLTNRIWNSSKPGFCPLDQYVTICTYVFLFTQPIVKLCSFTALRFIY